ncbi:hypothetical protein bas09_0067 [Changchunvirus paulsarasin]|uniref:Uncharacterized protein n=1 Tax=Escherichia phage PaulSarasin TaxID=2851973 RepID=A0AAE8B1Y5_9CAUD|nr:hypothetical protein bas09_0067 [Escherichia phage PaulSarasin]
MKEPGQFAIGIFIWLAVIFWIAWIIAR